MFADIYRGFAWSGELAQTASVRLLRESETQVTQSQGQQKQQRSGH